MQSPDNIIPLLRKEAKRLHRLACSDTCSHALPVLRRLIQQKVFRDVSLVDLYKNNQRIQRKHLLQLLALEDGYTSWSSYVNGLENVPENIEHPDTLKRRVKGYPNLWFRNMQEAQDYAREHGGTPVSAGAQAFIAIAE